MPIAYMGIGALLISALLTAIYMMDIVIRAFGSEKGRESGREIKDPDWKMIAPLGVFVAIIVYFGLHAAPMIKVLEEIIIGG